MAMIRKTIMSRLLFLQQTPLFSPRRFSTAAETLTPARQIGANGSLLLNKVKVKMSKSSITDILNTHMDQGKTINRFDVVSISDYLRKGKKYESALEMFDWIESNMLQITNSDRAIRIDLLCITTGLASAENYFNALEESEKTYRTYGALLCCYSREKVVDKALDVFEKMKDLNYTSTLSYNSILSLYLNCEQPEKVISLVQEMEEKRIAPDIYTYNLLINSYAALKKLDAVKGVLAKMENNNVKCDAFTHGNLAYIYHNSGLHEKASEHLKMIEDTKNMPREVALEDNRTLLRLYSYMNNLSGVNRSWEIMKSAFPTPPDNSSYLSMLVALSKMGNLEELEKFYKEWEEGGSWKYDFRLPNVVLEFYLKRNMIEKATALYETMSNKGVEPNLKARNLFAALCIKNNEIDLALKHLETGIEKLGPKLPNWFPTNDTLKLLVNYFNENKDDDRVGKFIEIIEKVGRLESKASIFCNRSH